MPDHPWSLVPASHTLLGPSLLTIETTLSNWRNTSQGSRDPHARRDAPDWWIDKMATTRIGRRLFSSVRRPQVPLNRLTSPASQADPERILAHCLRTERSVAWWLIFFVTTKGQEGWSRSREGLLCCWRLRDVYVITMWCGAKHEGRQGRIEMFTGLIYDRLLLLKIVLYYLIF